MNVLIKIINLVSLKW